MQAFHWLPSLHAWRPSQWNDCIWSLVASRCPNRREGRFREKKKNEGNVGGKQQEGVDRYSFKENRLSLIDPAVSKSVRPKDFTDKMSFGLRKFFIFLLHILFFGLTRFSKSVQMTGMSKKISKSLLIGTNFLSMRAKLAEIATCDCKK